jgi:hypothetical protein
VIGEGKGVRNPRIYASMWRGENPSVCDGSSKNTSTVEAVLRRVE